MFVEIMEWFLAVWLIGSMVVGIIIYPPLAIYLVFYLAICK